MIRDIPEDVCERQINLAGPSREHYLRTIEGAELQELLWMGGAIEDGPGRTALALALRRAACWR